jgi:hypothetical protein
VSLGAGSFGSGTFGEPGSGINGTAGQALLTAWSFKPGSQEVVLVNGSVVTGYQLGSGQYQPDWGNAIWEQFFSGQRGTQGARLAGAEPQNRPLSLPIGIQAVSPDFMHAALSVLWGLDDEWRRFGGVIKWRPQGATYNQYFDVLSSSARVLNWDWLYHNRSYVVAELAPVCAPYLFGDPYDIFDGFDTDSSGYYTKDADGALMVIKGGALQPTAIGTSRWRHTSRGFSYGDQQVTLKITTGSTVTSYLGSIFICADTAGAATYLAAELTGGNLNLVKRVVDTPSTLAGTAFALSANTTYWLRIRREGRRLDATVYTSEPTPLGAGGSGVNYTMTLAEHWAFAPGHTGFRFAAVALGERYDDFRVEPYTYSANVGLPDERPFYPKIAGDGPALGEFSVSVSGASNAPVWGLLGWWARAMIWNWCANGDFEDDDDGWSVAAVAGVTGAATSKARSTTAARNKYGGANLQVVCPATANTGATFKMRRRFYEGRTYVVLIWASAASATTLSRCRLGVSGDIASSSAVALSPTPTLYTAQWTPTTNQNGAYACFEITAATGSTLSIDGVCVFEARPATLTNSIVAGDGTCVVDRIPDDWPAVPFSAIAESEIIRVESIVNSTRTLTITRGLEGTTAASHASAIGIIPLPEIRGHYEGKGAQPPVGVIEAESADAGNLFTWAVTSSGSYRLGDYLYASGLGAAGSAAADWLIDPHLLVPDDYAKEEIAVEVWGRVVLHSGLTAPTVILSVAPENATVASGVLSSSYGAIRYSEEWGSAGKALVKPSSGEAVRFTRLGTVRLPVDLRRPLRSRLQVRVTWTGASSATSGLDYLVLVPVASRALSPSAKVNDASFPKFFASTAETLKTIRSDLSGLVSKPPFAPSSDHGLGGSLIELQGANSDILVKLSSLVPDDPTSDTTTEELSYTGYMHLAVTPRFRTARGS